MAIRGAGGTSGGLLEFVSGVVMAAAGGYLFLERVQVTTGFWYWYGYNAFGLSLIPLLMGVFVIFLNGRSFLGWLLALSGLGIVLIGIIAHLQIFFINTSLFQTLMMLILLVGGLGLIARGVREH